MSGYGRSAWPGGPEAIVPGGYDRRRAATEQAIISLVGLGLALMIYLDRARRAGFAQIDRRFERFEQRIDKRFDQVDKKIEQVDKKIEGSATRTDGRINELNRSVIELAQSVGRVEGRTEILSAVE